MMKLYQEVIWLAMVTGKFEGTKALFGLRGGELRGGELIAGSPAADHHHGVSFIRPIIQPLNVGRFNMDTAVSG
jgi:hypothetical protein